MQILHGGRKMLDITKLTVPKIKELLKKTNNLHIQTPRGYIYIVGGIKDGILSKLEDKKHYVCVNEKWVKVN